MTMRKHVLQGKGRAEPTAAELERRADAVQAKTKAVREKTKAEDCPEGINPECDCERCNVYFGDLASGRTPRISTQVAIVGDLPYTTLEGTRDAMSGFLEANGFAALP